MVKVILQLYPQVAATREERIEQRPIGRDAGRYQALIREMPTIVRAADELGLWGISSIEHHFHSEGYEVGPNPGLLDAYWAAMTSRIRSSNSIPASSAPWATSSRETAAANAGVLSFFLTDLGVMPWMPSGRTYAHARTKPLSSSTARRARSSGVSAGTSRYEAWAAIAWIISGGASRSSRRAMTWRGWPVSRSGKRS